MLSAIGIILLLAANAFFVAAEFALVKVRGLRIETLAEEGSTRARLTLRMLHELETYLAACQLGITMASLGLGWLGEPAVAALLEPAFHRLGLDEHLLHSLSFVIGFLLFSSLHIIVGEQVPKTFAIRKPEAMSLAIAWPLHAFYMICFPLNWALNWAAGAILRLCGVEEASHLEVVSGQELRGLIGISRKAGVMRKFESDMLGSILDLEDVEVAEVMTHRRAMVTLSSDTPIAEAVAFVQEQPFTRYPLWRNDPDTIVGILHAKDLLAAVFRAGDAAGELRLVDLASPPWFIPDTTSLVHQLTAFRQRRAHLALVVDEYGALQGLVTLEDIIEEIVGDIRDEKDVELPGVRPQPDGSVLVEGRVTLRDLNRQFEWDLPDEEASTVAGLVIHEAQRIPEVGQSFVFHGFRFEVLRRQRHQVTLLRMSPVATTAGGA
jgi:CBS domain containing-hemolysin-like protein